MLSGLIGFEWLRVVLSRFDLRGFVLFGVDLRWVLIDFNGCAWLWLGSTGCGLFRRVYGRY